MVTTRLRSGSASSQSTCPPRRPWRASSNGRACCAAVATRVVQPPISSISFSARLRARSFLKRGASWNWRAALDGISAETVNDAQLASIRREMATGNMETVPLEKAPRIAVYTPAEAQPWDDAVTLALKYAGIEFTPVYDDQVESGDLTKYDWLHLHHEDFTGQFNKFQLGYKDAPWFRDMVAKNKAVAKRLGFAYVPGLKKDVAEHIRQFVERGGFLFAM